MSKGGYLPAAILLGLILGAAVLLVAGYGFPVGIGVLAGLGLGVVATFGVVLAGRAGAGRSSSVHWLSTPGQDIVREHSQQFVRVVGVDQSPLNRVIAVGRAVEAHGTRLEFIALELRRDGGVGLFLALGQPPAGPLGHFGEVTVQDDVGTGYVAAAQAESAGSTTSRVTLRFAPSPPTNARSLTVTLLRFADPFAGGSDAVGPWPFVLDLDRP